MPLTRALFGRPLRPSEAAKEQINPVEGLSALSLDALTSVAYGPQALLVALGAGGLAALGLAPWITLAIVALLVLLVASYTQVISAYPGGGGAYAVARANLGTGLSLVAGAALIVDYVLTVAVSIAAGVGSLTSAFSPLAPYTLPICLGMLAVITFLTLRGLAEGARAFLVPTLAFIAAILVVIAVGLIHPLAPHLTARGAPLVATHTLETVGVLLVLQAFAAGCSALTGVEAIANGVPLFRRPQVTRARQTELSLGTLLAVMLLGLALLIQRFHVEPRTGDAVLNQIVGYALGRGWAFDGISILVTLVLALAANTSFGSLPVLASLLAKDNRLPHGFAIRGDRLVFNRGIWALALLAAILLAATGGNTDSLIPLFAIGVFSGFTLAQAGMVRHWLRGRAQGWWGRCGVHGLGGGASGSPPRPAPAPPPAGLHPRRGPLPPALPPHQPRPLPGPLHGRPRGGGDGRVSRGPGGSCRARGGLGTVGPGRTAGDPPLPVPLGGPSPAALHRLPQALRRPPGGGPHPGGPAPTFLAPGAPQPSGPRPQRRAPAPSQRAGCPAVDPPAQGVENAGGAIRCESQGGEGGERCRDQDAATAHGAWRTSLPRVCCVRR